MDLMCSPLLFTIAIYVERAMKRALFKNVPLPPVALGVSMICGLATGLFAPSAVAFILIFAAFFYGGGGFVTITDKTPKRRRIQPYAAWVLVVAIDLGVIFKNVLFEAPPIPHVAVAIAASICLLALLFSFSNR